MRNLIILTLQTIFFSLKCYNLGISLSILFIYFLPNFITLVKDIYKTAL